jgi:hypothetical protein
MQQHDNGTAFKDKGQARFHKSLQKQQGANDLFDKDLIGFYGSWRIPDESIRAVTSLFRSYPISRHDSFIFAVCLRQYLLQFIFSRK